MTAKDQLLTAHLSNEKERFDKAIAGVKALLNHKERGMGDLAARLLTVGSQALYSAMGGGIRESCPYYGVWGPHSVITRLEFIRYLVLIEVGKHDPALAYCHFDFTEGEFRPCSKDHEDAQPFFHQNLEVLCAVYPDSERLTTTLAIGVLDYHEEQNQLGNRYGIEEDGDDPAMYEPSEEGRLLAALADQLRS